MDDENLMSCLGQPFDEDDCLAENFETARLVGILVDNAGAPVGLRFQADNGAIFDSCDISSSLRCTLNPVFGISLISSMA